MSLLNNRNELLFLYDVKRCNPNGDPLDSNRPRIDENTGRCLVTDVRLKRTIRDYLFNKGYNGESGAKGDIFIRTEAVTGEERSKAYDGKQDFCEKFIDARLFGAVSAPGKASGSDTATDTEGGDDAKDAKKDKAAKGKSKSGKVFHFTGPVQFSMGYTLNKVNEPNFIKGTGAFATKEGADQKTFREEYNITYGLIAFHGVVNEFAAKPLGTTQKDIDELTEAMWNGTKDLLTRSKKGHMPRLLVKATYQSGFFIGDLCERVKMVLKDGKTMESLEDISDYVLDTTELNAVLEKYDDKIIAIEVQQDDRLELTAPIRTK